ncbi:MAG TPA: hypothetical protein VF077_01640, partial [Nitrospiraceae bacterium]
QDHGTWPTPDFIGNAHVSLEGLIRAGGAGDYWAKRVALMSPFIPLPTRGATDTVQMIYQFTGFSELVTANCALDGQMPAIPITNDVPAMSTFQINLKQRDPRFYSLVGQEVVMNPPSGGGGVTFPITFPVTFLAGSASSAVVFNSGNAYTSPVVVINGPCNDPTVSIARPDGSVEVWGLTGIYIPPGATVVADFKNRTILQDGQFSLFRYKSPQAKWWQLWDGNNNVQFTALNTDPTMTFCTLQWQNAYFF